MDAVWRSLDPEEPSLEHLCLTGWTRAEGTVVGVAGGRPYTLNYLVEIAPDGHPTFVGADVAGGAALTLRRSATGEWASGTRRPRPDLRGCADVDIRATPFTNTLPIRRLGLSVGESRELRAVWVDVPTLELRVARQRYKRTGEATYRYENLDSGYTNEITVDRFGLVTLYPGAFERLI
ncbi:hypothetical protein DAERI_030245 [Deinococcus aerius]|uniref:Uncharacterized protein n=1 Tax=Deinococcus aerius TaxID=200253 RepID=A0A2I9CTH6_9DEIO|nr:putative glycolipid-binding domain-containing protein [Deinococcus aerius]GBF05079.1 hypothetical protein DAERI_030245 [Deinococcus aerius]